jgi:WD40 repeat protein
VAQTIETSNPYVIDQPVVEEAQFFGREAKLNWAVELLDERGGRRVLVVQGSYRIGKTSFLYQLQRRLHQTALLIDLSEAQSDSLGHLLWRVAAEIASKVALLADRSFPAPELNDFLADANHFQESFLPSVLKALRRIRLLLAFDGLESLDGGEGLVREAFFAYLADLMHQDTGLSLVLAVEEWPQNARDAFRESYRLRLGPLDRAAATHLVVEQSDGVLDFDYQALRKVLEVSSGHPYIVQLTGHELYERCSATGRVTEKDVEAVLGQLLELASEYVEHLWDGLSPKARVVVSALASLRGVRDILLEQDLRYALKQKRAGLSPEEIAAACEELVDRDLLERLGAMSYQFKVELVRLWLAERKSVDIWRETRGASAVAATAGDWIGRFLWPLIGLLSATALVFSCLLSWPALGNGEAPTPTPEETREGAGLSLSMVTATPDPRRTELPVPTPRPPALDIAYMEWDEDTGTWDIYAMSRDASMVDRLTDNEADDTSPAWSRDRGWLVFVSERDGNQEIYRLDLPDAVPLNLSNNPAPDWTPAISPDGTKVVFSSMRDGNWELYLMDADGSQPARMTFNQDPDYSPAWSPDGSKIAFVSERDGNLEIYVMASDGSQETRLTFNDELDLSPAWSPDSSQIAFESYRQGNMEIYVMNADGLEQSNVSNYALADDHGPTWSEDGLGLVFYSNREGNWDLYFMNVISGEAVNLTNSPIPQQEPFWNS